ncbi:MAG: hypothetical protein ABSE22_10250 [Xanthobacteraceae bacterium]
MRAVLTLPFVLAVVLVAMVAGFIAYALWPTWPSKPTALDAPTIPITVAGVLFDVPPAAIRAAVQRHPGQQERVDLAFDWPSLTPPNVDDKPSDKPALNAENAAAAATASESKRLFVTIAALGAVLPPLERLRTIYPRYFESQATAASDGMAVLPFRAGTPYEGEDLVYLGGNPEQFFARCTRPARSVPGTCIHEQVLDRALITLRFPRDWLGDWRNVAAGFDRLLAQLHPQAR